MTTDQANSIFQADGEQFVPTGQARGPWDPQALHGGAPAALIAAAFERHEPSPETRLARLGFELLRPIPFAPLTVTTITVRGGRRVQELSAELHAELGEGGRQLICRASGLRVQQVPGGLPEPPGGTPLPEPMPGPDQGQAFRFALNDDDHESFAATAMEMRWHDDPKALGPGRVWMRLRHPLVAGEPLTPLARLAATADFGNGISAALPFERFVFINADLSIHLHRLPMGEWIGIDARTILQPGGTGLSESVLHDEHGPVGRSFQTLFVAAR